MLTLLPLDAETVSVVDALPGSFHGDPVETGRPAVESGLAMLDANGDFTDGVITHEGRWLGGEVFVSFDKKAVGRLAALGISAQLP